MIWNFDPVLFSFGFLTVHWYGAIFAAAILIGLQLCKYMYGLEGKSQKNIDDLLVYVVVGVIVGARLAHCFFYEPGYFFANPFKVLAIWEGGLASHGGGLGAIMGIYLYSRKYQASFVWLLDRVSIPTALFGFFVRSANFLNSEIIGAKSNVPWAVVFEHVDSAPRHPAQLYEALGYLLVFIFLFFLYKQAKLRQSSGMLLGLFLTLIFTVRFMVEFVKEPQEAYSLSLGLNTGQLLSLPFLLLGAGLLVLVVLRHKKA